MKYVSPATERRKEKQRKRKKAILMGVCVALFALVVVVAISFLGSDKPDGSASGSQQVQQDSTQTQQQQETVPEVQQTPQPAQKPKNKVSLFGKIKSLFAKTEPMQHTYPAMAFGRSIETEAHTIVSLSPLATEIILSSPSQSALVAVSNYCNKYGNDSLMTVGTPLVPNTDKIIQLDPDYLIIQTPLAENDRIMLEQSGITVLQLNAPESLEDLQEIYRSITVLTHGGDIATFESERVIVNIKNKLELYTKALENVEKKSVVMLFNSYGMVATDDTFEGNILANFFRIDIDGSDYYAGDLSAVAATNPQVLIVSNYIGEAELVNMGFGNSDAFAKGRVYYVDIQQFENYTAESVLTLAGIANDVYGDRIQPQIFTDTETTE